MDTPISNDNRPITNPEPAPARQGASDAPAKRRPAGCAAPTDTMTRCAAGSNLLTMLRGGAAADVNLVPDALDQASNGFQLGVEAFTRAGKAAAKTRDAQQVARNGTSTARTLGQVANVLAVAGGVAAAVEEACNNDSYHTVTGRAAGALGVGGAQTVAGLTPHGTAANMVSGLVDDVYRLGQSYGVLGEGPPPKAMEVYNNAGRFVGMLAEVGVAQFEPAVDARGRRNRGGWRAVEGFVHHAKREQGSVSRGLVHAGEWLGDKGYDAYSWVKGKLGF
ncbi:MAG TPA: hypothetical protein VMT16_12870 [Thermoanaerobaculia bacterium]|nr:hypothetical protein [Thermoanaerobaculia bacterium]